MYSKNIYLHNIILSLKCNNYLIFKNFCGQLKFPKFRRYNKYIRLKVILCVESQVFQDGRADIIDTNRQNFSLNCWIKNIFLKIEPKTNTINASLIDTTQLSIEDLLHLIIISPLRRILQKYNIYLLHSGVVSKEDKAILFSAGPGGGKSTVVASFLLSGYDFLSDEFALLKDNKIFAFPLKIKLDNVALKYLRAYRKMAPSFYAKEVFPLGQVEYSNPTLTLFLRQAKTDLKYPRLRKLNPYEAFSLLAYDKVNSLTYERNALLRRRQLEALSNIAQRTRCYLIVYNLKHIKQIPRLIQRFI